MNKKIQITAVVKVLTAVYSRLFSKQRQGCSLCLNFTHGFTEAQYNH